MVLTSISIVQQGKKSISADHQPRIFLNKPAAVVARFASNAGKISNVYLHAGENRKNPGIENITQPNFSHNTGLGYSKIGLRIGISMVTTENLKQGHLN